MSEKTIRQWIAQVTDRLKKHWDAQGHWYIIAYGVLVIGILAI